MPFSVFADSVSPLLADAPKTYSTSAAPTKVIKVSGGSLQLWCRVARPVSNVKLPHPTLRHRLVPRLCLRYGCYSLPLLTSLAPVSRFRFSEVRDLSPARKGFHRYQVFYLVNIDINLWLVVYIKIFLRISGQLIILPRQNPAKVASVGGERQGQAASPFASRKSSFFLRCAPQKEYFPSQNLAPPPTPAGKSNAFLLFLLSVFFLLFSGNGN